MRVAAAFFDLFLGAHFGDDQSGAKGRDRRRDHVVPKSETETAGTLSEIEQSLVQRVNAGDVTAFDELVDAYFDRVARFAYGMVGDRAAAEDIAQDVLMRVWELGAQWRPHGTIAAYLFRAARNRSITTVAHMRMRDRLRPWIAGAFRAHEVSPAPDQAMVDAELVAELRAAIARLPERRRTALRLRYEEGMTYPAMAQVMGTSVKSAEQFVMHAVAALRKTLAKRI